MFEMKKPLAPDTRLSPIPTVASLAPRIDDELMPKLIALGNERSSHLDEARALATSEDTTSDFIDAERERRVAEILGRIPPQPQKTHAGRKQEVAQRIRDIDAASEILRREVATERNRAGAIIRERVVPQHKARVADLCRALLGVHKANVAYWALIEALQNDGVGTANFGDHLPNFIGAPRDINSPLGLFLKECSRGGLFPTQEIPSELR